MKEEPLDAIPCLNAAEWETWEKGSKSMSIKSLHSLQQHQNMIQATAKIAILNELVRSRQQHRA